MKCDTTFLALARGMFLVCMLVGMIRAQVPANPKNPDPELIGQLSNQLSVTPKQATSGAGAIFGLVKSHISAGGFSRLAAVVPGMSGFLNAAPAAGGASSTSLAPGLPASASGLTSLASSFQSIGLSPSMIGKFAPIMENYMSKKGGSGLASVFSGALK